MTGQGETLHPIEKRLLNSLLSLREGDGREFPEEDVRQRAGLDRASFRRGVEWLLTKGLINVTGSRTLSTVLLSETGAGYLKEGLPAERTLAFLKGRGEEGAPFSVIEGILREEEEPRRVVGNLIREGCVMVRGGGIFLSTGKGLESSETGLLKGIMEIVRDAGGQGLPLDFLDDKGKELVEKNRKKRGRERAVFRKREETIRTIALSEEGENVAGALRGEVEMEEVSTLTPEMLKDGGWKGVRIRRYDLSIPPPYRPSGRKHYYREFLDYVAKKLTRLGFREMRGPIVETEFWNMDALFMPQFHPARQIHDVYHVKGPELADPRSAGEFLKRVAEVHEKGGGTGSRGWGYPFDIKRSLSLVLRSQGTSLSARTLASGPGVPGKYFAIARCFRYDTVDATHAPDFFQVEGIVVSERGNMRTLLGLLELFARQIAGADEIKFFPAYFPFTEPSVEVHMRHPEIGWMELGGAGIFRPEVTLPLGVSVPVLAWGLGLDRMAMVYMGIKDIRDLFSPDLEFIRSRKFPLIEI